MTTSPFPVRQWSLPQIAWVFGLGGDVEVKCSECGKPIGNDDLIQRQLAKFVPVGETAKVKHECCDDPEGVVVWGTAHADARVEAARGHKTRVNYYLYRHRNG